MLQELENNLKTLIAAYETQLGRADRLEKELAKTKREAEEAKDKVKELEEKVDKLALASAFTSSTGENKEAVERINSLIATINKALEML